jgi:hypothetical protein
MTDAQQLIAFSVQPDGTILLVDSARNEYRCCTPDELWADMREIADDDSLPRAAVVPADAVELAAVEAAGEMNELGAELAQEVVESGTGSGALGRLAAALAKRHGPDAVQILRNVSRPNRLNGRGRRK